VLSPEVRRKDEGKDVGSDGWCFATPFQPDAFRNMPDVVETMHGFVAAFSPERTRVAFLSPNRHGATIDGFLPGRDLLDKLLNISTVEVLGMDGRRRNVNGLLLADFFDFTMSTNPALSGIYRRPRCGRGQGKIGALLMKNISCAQQPIHSFCGEITSSERRPVNPSLWRSTSR